MAMKRLCIDCHYYVDFSCTHDVNTSPTKSMFEMRCPGGKCEDGQYFLARIAREASAHTPSSANNAATEGQFSLFSDT